MYTKKGALDRCWAWTESSCAELAWSFPGVVIESSARYLRTLLRLISISEQSGHHICPVLYMYSIPAFAHPQNTIRVTLGEKKAWNKENTVLNCESLDDQKISRTRSISAGVVPCMINWLSSSTCCRVKLTQSWEVGASWLDGVSKLSGTSSISSSPEVLCWYLRQLLNFLLRTLSDYMRRGLRAGSPPETPGGLVSQISLSRFDSGNLCVTKRSLKSQDSRQTV
jgi:hypothetical protein